MNSRRYARMAPHVRGRVFLLRPPSSDRRALWGMEILNGNTGRVLATDSCTELGSLIALADEATAVYRAGWFWSVRKKDVRP